MRHLNFQQDGIAETLVNFFRVPLAPKHHGIPQARTWLVPDFFINFPWDLVLQDPGDPGTLGKLWKDNSSSGPIKK